MQIDYLSCFHVDYTLLHAKNINWTLLHAPKYFLFQFGNLFLTLKVHINGMGWGGVGHEGVGWGEGVM